MFIYCPQCQSSTIKFIEKRYFSCGECSFTYFHNTASAVAGIIIYRKKILFTHRAKSPGLGLLDLPGGFVDANESLEQALSREIKEELGIKVGGWQYLCSQPNIYQYKNITYQTLDSIFVKEIQDLPHCVLQKSEVDKISWLTLTEVNLDDLAFSSVKAGLKYYSNKELG